MKRSIWTILLPALCCVLLAGCASPAASPSAPTAPAAAPGNVMPNVPVDGGRTDGSDPGAPKTIQSAEITAFSCRFSTVSAAEPGRLGNRVYILEAKPENGAVKGEYTVYDAYGELWRKRSFTADDARFDGGFLGELADVLERYELARHNGTSVRVAGLPDDFGATLDVSFASGESIYAADNQDNFLSDSAMDALAQLFERAAAAPPEILPFSAETDSEMKQLDGGGWACVDRTVYTLGYRASDGEPQQPDGCESLAEAVARGPFADC